MPFPGIDGAENENSKSGHGHFVYLPRDDLVPRFDGPLSAPDLGIDFNDWLSDSGVGVAPKDFIGTSVKVLPKRRKKRWAKNYFEFFFDFLRRNV